MTGVAVVGSTGSIGRAALDVVRRLGGTHRVVGLSASTRWETLLGQAREFRPLRVAIADEQAASRLRAAIEADGSARGTEVVSGPSAAAEVAAMPEADVVVSAVVGAAGLEPTLAAVRAGRRVALANKESVVMAGPILFAEAARSGATLLPVDSEHSAVFQALLAGRREDVARIILTASGGPFRERPAAELASVTPEEALAHPTWSMGPKITIDSATLMNKALEVVEARWWFDCPAERIDVWIHPQSVVHSMVEFVDGSIVAELGPADMRLPIQYALTYPERKPGPARPMRPEDMRALTFGRPDAERFPALGLGRRAACEGGVMGAVLSAANEVAVEAFLAGACRFTDIPRAVEEAMDRAPVVAEPALDEVIEADRAARASAVESLGLGRPAPAVRAPVLDGRGG